MGNCFAVEKDEKDKTFKKVPTEEDQISLSARPVIRNFKMYSKTVVATFT